MTRISDYFRSLRYNWRLSRALNAEFFPGSGVYDPFLIDVLNTLAIQTDPRLSEKVKTGFWYVIYGCYHNVTFEHTEIENYQAAFKV